MKKKLSILLQSIGVMSILTIGIVAFVLISAGSWMDVDEAPQHCDYIIPLAGDANRLVDAARLYREGYANLILLSNSKPPLPTRYQKLMWAMGYPRLTRKEITKLILKHEGVENAHTEEFGHGHVSTIEEAEALKMYLQGASARILIVTSPYHALRARTIFQRVLPDCQIIVTASKEGRFPQKWWQDQTAAQNIIMELVKTLHFLVGGAFRSTD